MNKYSNDLRIKYYIPHLLFKKTTIRKRVAYALNKYLVHQSMKTINHFLTQFIHSASKETVNGYRSDLHSFQNFLCERFELSQQELENREEQILKMITEADIYAYISFIQKVTGNRERAINRKLSALKQYFKYLKTNHIVDYNVAAEIKTLKYELPEQKILTINECNHLIQSIQGKNRIRDTLIIGMILVCGLRVSELIDIKTNDIGEDYIMVGCENENKRVVWLNEPLKSILSHFLSAQCVTVSDYLFSSDSVNPISKRTVHQIVVKHFKAADLYDKGETTESLRKTCRMLLKVYCGMDSIEIDRYTGKQNGTFINQNSPILIGKASVNQIPIVIKLEM